MKNLIIIAVIVLVGLGGYLYTQKTIPIPTPEPSSQTLPAPRAVEGSPVTNPDPTAEWKTYTNEKYGFSFKYPDNLDGKTWPCDDGLPGYKYGPKVLLDSESREGDYGGVFSFCVMQRDKTPESGSIYGKVIPLNQSGYFFKFDSSQSKSLANQILSTFRFTK